MLFKKILSEKQKNFFDFGDVHSRLRAAARSVFVGACPPKTRILNYTA
jgi:hypothetical protein